MLTKARILSLVLVAAPGAALAQPTSFVIPPTLATTPGTLSDATMFNSSARTFQFVVPASDLPHPPPGAFYTGFTARTTASGPLPAQDLTFQNYDVYLGQYAGQLGVPLNTSFAANVVPGTEVQVRAGSMTIPAGTFPGGGSPNSFSQFHVDFNQATLFVAPGVNLVVTVRHTGNGASSPGMDASSSGGNYNTMFADSYTAQSGTSSDSYTTTQFWFDAGFACYPNCDNTCNPTCLNVADFTCFLQRFAAGHEYANCDFSTSPPTLNVADFTCFLQRYAAGCP